MNVDIAYTQSLSPGTHIEEFIIERVLGAGGFGITYLAMDTHLGRKVVIKENLPAQFCFRDPSSMSVSPRHTHGEDADNFLWSLENFSKEASMLASLDHPGIVKVLRSFHALGTAYFVMPYVEGVALDELATQRQGKPFTEAELRGLLERVLSALGYLHERGIYHRDIKPGNILITSEGNSVLIDFGSARQLLSARSMTVVESAGYTPFEQLQSRGNVGPWSDLYALGATLEKMLTGEAPPKATDRIMEDPRRELSRNPLFNQYYSLSFLRAIDIAVSVNPQQRWKSCDEWLLGLKEISSSNTEPSTPPVRKPAKTAPILYPSQEQNALKSSKAERRRLSKADGNWLVIGACGLAILFMAIVVFVDSDKSDEIANRVASSDLPQPSSPFAAATMKPSAWNKLAEAGDPLAQALLGDALYWGGQKKYGVDKDSAEGVRWIKKSADAEHPLGLYLLGMLRESGCEWLPKDKDLAERNYTEAISMGLAREAENGGPVWWTSLAQALEHGNAVTADPKTAVIWYRRTAEAGYVDGMRGLGNCYANGTGVAADEVEAVKWFRMAAEEGDTKGMNLLGMCYADGSGVSEDATEAVKWFRKSAEAGDGQGMFSLGFCYDDGRGVAEDASAAVKCYRMAAEAGDTKGMIFLGLCYADGRGVVADASEAVKWFRKAAEVGDTTGMNRLGVCYDNGTGVAKDEVEAVKWFRMAAEEGDTKGMNLLGMCYADGRGVVADASEAVKWFRKAAEAGDTTGMNWLGYYYEYGTGFAKDEVEAVKWYRKSAEAGDARGMCNLGLCYDNGTGVAKDEVEAVKWFRKSAEAGDTAGMCNLGLCYEYGTGVVKDEVEAVKYYRNSAERDEAQGIMYLGRCYAEGKGVEQNKEEAIKLFMIVNESGNETEKKEAQEYLQKLLK